jgi:hypothetical protein
VCGNGNIGSRRAYDRAAIKFRGLEADINFSLGDYEDDLKQVMVASNGFYSFPMINSHAVD